MSLLFFGIFLFLAFLSASFIWSFKKNSFMEKEAKRCINGLCEIDKQWSPEGRIYTKGFKIIESNGKRSFIKQAKLCDMGILE